MQSRLWEGGESSNGLVSSSHSWHQGRWENGGKKTKEEVEQNMAAGGAGAGGAGGVGARSVKLSDLLAKVWRDAT